MQFDANDIIKRQARMESERQGFDVMREEIAQLMLPRQADFLSGDFSLSRTGQGQRRTAKIIDETGIQAVDHGVSVFEGEVIPQGGMWQTLVADDENLMKNLGVRQWFEAKTRQLFALRNSPRSGFAAQVHESVASLLAFGEQAMRPEILRAPGGMPIGLSYRSEHLAQIFHEEDHRGVIDTVHRKFTLTHRQALQMFPKAPPEAARKGERDGKLDERATYLHVIEPNRQFQEGRLDATGKPFASCYVELGQREVFSVGGYRTMPLTVSRYEKSPNEEYGRGPGMTALPSVKACQRIRADLITAVEFAARPALGAHDDLLDQLLRYSPGGVTYGAIDDRGNPLLKPLFENADISAAAQLLNETRDVIRRAFFVDLYIARQELKSHVSAQEMMQREQEKGVLLAPLKRQETDWFTPMADRELDLMNEMGLLDDMPGELREANASYLIRYDNPLGRAREAGEASGYYQLQAGIAPLAQLDRSGAIVAEFLERYPSRKVIPALGRIHGVPASWEASDEERQAAREERENAQNTEQLLAAGDAAAGIADKLAGAGLGGDANAA